MAYHIPTTKQPRRGTLYAREELLVISKYKTEYKEQTTRALRANVLRNKILVDLFNYWDAHDKLPSDGEESMERVKVTHSTIISVKSTECELQRDLLPGCEITGARMLCSAVQSHHEDENN